MAVPSNVSYPSGGTWFDTLKKSFVDVPVDASKDNAIPTTDFLEASESLTTLFGIEPATQLTLRKQLLRKSRCPWLNGLYTCQK